MKWLGITMVLLVFVLALAYLVLPIILGKWGRK